MDILSLAGQNLVSPMVLSFALGLAAALARSDLSVPEAAAKLLSLYLLFAIGFKGGVSVNESGASLRLGLALGAGLVLSALIPFVAYAFLRAVTRLDPLDAASVAAHYGSISIVTFVAATASLTALGIDYEGYMVAVAAAMEAPAILSALWLIGRQRAGASEADAGLLREILLNGSIVLLVGAFLIGLITGTEGRAEIAAFIDAPFKGVLCLFLLDMGLVAGRGLLRSGRQVSPAVVGFGIVMPLVGGALGLASGAAIGLSPGGVALMTTLAASASYIAVPAAMRVALPEANPAISLTLALGITFPFNLVLGIPLYIAAAGLIAG
jgi:uncharacterized protein